MSDSRSTIDQTGLWGEGGIPIPAELDADVGMNLISAGFDIVVVNRVNERLYGKAMTQFLGKKCYEEFEKRDSVCPHCPGVEALKTGLPCTRENEGIRDDGSHFVVLCTAYPVLGPGNKPVGFIELERDITGERDEEKTSAVLGNLRFALTKADECSWALRYALDAALSLDGVESGCTFLVDSSTGARTSVSSRGSTAGYASLTESLDPLRGAAVEIRVQGEATATCGEADARPLPYACLRIRNGARTSALLLLGLSSLEAAAAMRVALEALIEIVANAISRIEGEHSRRQQRARLRHTLQNLPVPVICLDGEARVTLCNRAAERLLGHRVGEVLDASSPWLSPQSLLEISRLLGSADVIEPETIRIRNEDAESTMAVMVAPFNDQIDDTSRLVLIGDRLTSSC
jgi:PAS domain S-box-containing protein